MTTIIVPTYNESENIAELKRRLPKDVHVLVVDDSSDMKTADTAREAGFQVIHRTNKRGLSSAVIDGIAASQSEKIIVIDADLQHPPELIPELIEQLDTHNFVVASRYVEGGGCKEWDLDRKIISRLANLLARPLTNVKDAVSGFFGFKRKGLPDLQSVNSNGFKIMLELLVKGNWSPVAEIPYTFGIRTRGRTKMRWEQIRDYLLQLIQLYLYKFRWLRFGIVGASGTLVYFPILYLLTELTPLWYLPSAVVGIVCASTWNYFFNDFWTFRGQKRVAHNHLKGWGKYQLMSGITDGIYLGTFALLTELSGMYYMLSAAVTMLIIFVAKYFVARNWIWRR